VNGEGGAPSLLFYPFLPVFNFGPDYFISKSQAPAQAVRVRARESHQGAPMLMQYMRGNTQLAAKKERKILLPQERLLWR